MPLQLRNPHSIEAALIHRPQDVLDFTPPPQTSAAGWERVLKLAAENRIRMAAPDRSQRNRGSGGREGLRQGFAGATVKEKASVTVEELFKDAPERAGGRGLWLALDQVQDPQNLGAIFRSAAFFGVQGIVMTQENSSPLTSTVYDVGSGGVEYVPFCIHTNLQRAFEVAKKAGLWILGSSEHAREELYKVSRDRPWLLVLGNEEKGMRRLTQEACDVLCRIPANGGVTSLNVSVSAGIMISELTSHK